MDWFLEPAREFWFKMLSLMLFSILERPFWLRPLIGSLLAPIGGLFDYFEPTLLATYLLLNIGGFPPGIYENAAPFPKYYLG